MAELVVRPGADVAVDASFEAGAKAAELIFTLMTGRFVLPLLLVAAVYWLEAGLPLVAVVVGVNTDVYGVKVGAATFYYD